MSSVTRTDAQVASLKASFATLNATQAANILVTKELTEDQVESLLGLTALNEEEKEAIRLKWKSVAGSGAEATATNTLTFSWGNLTTAIWANIKAMWTWMTTTPLGIITLIVAGFAALIGAYDLLTTSIDEHIEKLQELDQEYETNESNLRSLQNELVATQQRITELESMDSLTLVEQGELAKLKETNSELVREVELLKQRNAEIAKEREKEAEEAWRKMSEVRSGLNPDYSTDVEYAEYLMRHIKQWDEQIDKLWADGVLDKTEQETEKRLSGMRDQFEEKLIEIRDIAAKINIDESNAFVDRIAAFLNPSYAFEQLQATIPDTVEASMSYIQDVVEESGGKLTDSADKLIRKLKQRDGFQDWVDSAINMGVITNDTNQSIWELIKAIGSIQSELKTTAIQVDLFAERLASDTDILNTALKNIEDGNIDAIFTSKNIDDILDKFPDLIDELKAYSDGLIDVEKLQNAFNNAIVDFDTDAICDGINDIIDAGETYGAKSNQVLQAVQNLEKTIPGLVDVLYDQETGHLKVSSSAMLSADAMYEAAKAAIEASRQAAMADLTHLTSQFNELAASATLAYGSVATGARIAREELMFQQTVGKNNGSSGTAISNGNQAIKELNDYYDNLLKSLASAKTKYQNTASSSKEKDAWKEAFEAEYKEHKHAVNMEKETLEEFYAWLESANQKYFANNKKYLDEYRTYTEEVFKGLRSLADDKFSDGEHLIFLWGKHGGKEDQIIAKYKELQAAAHDAAEEIRASMRAAGFSSEEIESSDAIQSLSRKWWEYQDAIQEVSKTFNEDMHDSLESLLDLTKDLIRHEKELEKDALKEQVDSYREIIDLKKEMLKLSERERNYAEEIEEKTAAIAKLQTRIDTLSLDDSRAALLERGALAEELAELQKDLADTQREHYLDTVEDQLDKELSDYEKAQDVKIDEIDDFLDNQEKLNQAALDRLEGMTSSTFDSLLSYAQAYTSTTRAELISMWEDAKKAAAEYGSFTQAFNQTTANDDGTYNIPSTAGRQQAIINEMRSNSLKWHTLSKEEQDEMYRNNPNKSLAKELEALTGRKIVLGSDGYWHYDTVSGEKVYTLHTGGVVGSDTIPTPKQDELFALLQKREIVLNETQQSNLWHMLSELAPLQMLKRSLSAVAGLRQEINSDTSPYIDASIHIDGSLPDDQMLSVLQKHERKIANMLFKHFK